MGKPKILIVEDEVLIGFHVQMELSRAGYEVVGPVATGEEAIESVQIENPDIILMDIRLMGGMDGIEAARRIAAFSHAGIIFVTGYDDLALKERALFLNPLAYLSKPVGARHIDALLKC